MGLLPLYARVPVSGAVADVDVFVRSGWVGVGSDRNAGPTIMMAQDIRNADILETTVSGRRVDKYSVLAETAYIETVDQNVAVLPRGRRLNLNAASLIVLTSAPHYSEITNPNLTTVADDDSRTIAGINRRGLLRVGADFDRRFAGCHANWAAVYFP
jgi:hypothetical protein